MNDENHEEAVVNQDVQETENTEIIEESSQETHDVTEEPEVSEESKPEEEPWQKVDESTSIPKFAHTKKVKKLRGQLSDKDREIDELKSRLKQVEERGFTQQPSASNLKRPQQYDYDTDEEYERALAKYEDDLFNSKFQQIEQKRQQEQMYRTHHQTLTKAVEDHYNRASELIEKAGISPEVYQASDAAVRNAINTIIPGRGDIVVDQMIANLGPGSDKVMYYIGRNQEALNSFKSLLLEDPSGIKASIYLGEQKNRLTTPTKLKSRAPSPSPTANGDANTGASHSAIKKKYDAAHKKGNYQDAWAFRREARLAGVDTSKW